MRQAILPVALVACIVTYTHTARAAPNCDRLQTPQQILDGLAATDQEVRFRAQECGLASSDRFARGLVVQKLLSGNRMDFTLSNAPGDENGSKIVSTIPPIAAERLTWTEDKRHFTGYGGPHTSSISGSLIGDVMTIVFPAIDVEKQILNCQARLILNNDRTALVGPFTCPNLQGRLTIQVDL